MPRTPLCLLLILVACLGLSSSPAFPQPVTYDVTLESGMWIGCQPPCFCPVVVLGSVVGSFEMELASATANVENYALSNVSISAAAAAGAVIDVTGSGTLTRNLSSHDIIMTIDSMFGGAPTTFTTTYYDPSVTFPELCLQLADGPPCNATFLTLHASPTPPPFHRGDYNQDSVVDLGDTLRVLSYLFPTDMDGDGIPDGSTIDCHDACDANDDGTVNLSDAVRVLNALFGSPPDTLPQGCAADGTADSVDCMVASC